MSELAPPFSNSPMEPRNHEVPRQAARNVRPFGADVLRSYANALETMPLVGAKSPTEIQTIAGGQRCGTDYVTPDE